MIEPDLKSDVFAIEICKGQLTELKNNAVFASEKFRITALPLIKRAWRC